MAKVKEIKMTIDGKEYSYNVNVNKDGIFKVVLDSDVSKKLGLERNTFFDKDLSKVESPILTAVHDYMTASKEYSLLIEISYMANGFYSCESLIGRKRFSDTFFSGRDISSLKFDYEILIKETAPYLKKPNYYTARLITDYDLERKGRGVEIRDINGYCANNTYYNTPNESTIPYSKEAIETLDKAKEGIKSISKILLDVVSQDSDKIEQLLINNKLLK